MSETHQAGGLCGRIRSEYAGEIGPAGICHCEECRQVTGDAFNISVGLDRTGFAVSCSRLSTSIETATLLPISTVLPIGSETRMKRSFSASGTPISCGALPIGVTRL